ncbi:MAG: hypothetical protein AAB288_06515 [Acidobacteriota bacterium]
MEKAHVAQLSLVWRKRTCGGGRTSREFLDFVIDGESLWERIDSDLISCLGWLADELNQKHVRRLLCKVPADFPDERRSLFICPECAELGCGALTAVIERIDDNIVWRDFGIQNDHTDEIWRTDLADLGPFFFNATEYYQVLNSGIDFNNEQ